VGAAPGRSGRDVSRCIDVGRGLKLLVGAVAVMVAAVGVLLSVWLVSDIASVHDACDRTVPWFEGILVDTAHRSWQPPIVRCTMVDGAGHSYATSLWGWGALAALAVLDVVAATVVVMAFRRMRRAAKLSLAVVGRRRI
jgi:hypothetical protein